MGEHAETQTLRKKLLQSLQFSFPSPLMPTEKQSFTSKLNTCGMTAKEIADSTRTPLRTVYAWLAGTNTPGHLAQMSILAAVKPARKRPALVRQSA